MPANVQTMAYVGEVPWHGIGTPIPPGVAAAEMIKSAGLDWEVEKRPARGARSIKKARGEEQFSRYEIIRLPRPKRDEQEVTLGIVTAKYQPLQNMDAFNFFDPLIDQEKSYFETAGALGDGERVWVMAKMPEAISVVRGDECHKYLLLSNTHTGQGAVIVKFTAMRVVCNNTLLLALQDGQKAFRVRHSKSMKERLDQIGELLTAINEAYALAAELFKAIAKKPLTTKLLDQYLELIFPRTDAQEQAESTPPKRGYVRELLETAPDLQIEGVRGTLWAAYNAVTRFEDYRVVRNETNSGRLNRVWFGPGADVKLKALQVATQLAQSS